MSNSTNLTLRNIVIGLLFAVLIVPLIVSTSLFFPYISGKGFLFRLIIEIAFAVYLILIIRDKSYLPRKSLISWSLVALLGVMAIATVFSENPGKSFWSNYERMEGYITLLHLGAYFVMLAGVFTKNIWAIFLNSSLAASVVIGAYAFRDRFGDNPLERIQGTLGNSTYLGVYALLHIFLAAFLALRLVEQRGGFKKSINPIIAYTVIGIFNAYVMYSTGTRGSFVGLLIGGVVTTILIAIFEKNRPVIRKSAVGVCIAIVVAILALGAAKNTSFVQESPLLSRFGALITTDIGSVIAEQGRARSLIWGMALEGFKDRPVFGWGLESFNYVFAEHYNPQMYDQEQWFDRSHNVFLDWLIAGGALGLISYLALFAAIIYLIWKKPEHPDESWTAAERSVLTGLLIAYFVHNMFVFDNLISYLFFFMLLAYVHRRSTAHLAHLNHGPWIKNEGTQYIVNTVIVVLIGASLYIGVYLPYIQNKNLIGALKANQGVSENNTELPANQRGSETLRFFKKATTNNTIGRFEVRERLAEIGPQVVTDSQNNSAETIQAFENLVQSEFQKQLTTTPNDPRAYMFYGMYLFQTSRYDQAIEVFKKTVELSPKKQSFLTQLAIAYYAKQDYANASMYLKRAYEEVKTNPDALGIYATVEIYAGNLTTFDALVAEGKINGIDLNSDARVIQALLETKNFTRLINIAKQKIAENPNDIQARVSAAAIYVKAGDRAAAIRELRAAIQLEPLFKDKAEEYIKIIQAGGDPSAQQ